VIIDGRLLIGIWQFSRMLENAYPSLQNDFHLLHVVQLPGVGASIFEEMPSTG
jgi:hypothetical protein